MNITINRISENNESTEYFIYNVTRTDTSLPQSIAWMVSPLTDKGYNNRAADATDFNGGIIPAGTLHFDIGQSDATFTFKVNNDHAIEHSEEIFKVGLVGTTVYLEDAIIDDEQKQTEFTLSAPRLEANTAYITHANRATNIFQIELNAAATYTFDFTPLPNQAFADGGWGLYDTWGTAIDDYIWTNPWQYTPDTTGIYFLDLRASFNHGDFQFTAKTSVESNRVQAEQHLATYGLTLDQGVAFVLDHLEQPALIYETAHAFGVNRAMLAGMANVDIDLVDAFFAAHGLEPALLG
ncbi:MAG: hypothetical protein RBS36_04615 [Thiomicrospira sp.]|nr:hypothetical protein [Thiomicrospira sp.]